MNPPKEAETDILSQTAWSINLEEAGTGVCWEPWEPRLLRPPRPRRVIVSRVRLQRANGLRNLQVLAGSFLGMFFVSHLTGVFSGRLQHIDTTFAWATGGPGGLLSNTRSPSFLPYYSLAVLAFGVHAAVAARWTLAGVLGPARALKLCYGLLAISAAATLAMLLPLCGVHSQ